MKTRTPPTPPELEMLFLCVRDFLGQNIESQISRLVTGEFSWEKCYQQSINHQITPLVWHQLKKRDDLSIPPYIYQAFDDFCKKNNRKASIHNLEIAKIARVFAQQDISFFAFKGMTLALHTYGSLSLRHAGDIDLMLLDVEMLPAADALILALGYERYQSHPKNLTPKQKKYFYKLYKDIVYVHPISGIILELHHRWLLYEELFPMAVKDAWKKRQTMTLSNTKISYLNPYDHLLYLFCHGAISVWFRAKWLADIAVIIKDWRQSDFQILRDYADKLGITKMVFTGLLLSNRYYSVPNNDSLSVFQQGYKIESVENACRYVSRQIITQSILIMHTKKMVHKVPDSYQYIQYHLGLRDNIRYKKNLLLVHAANIDDWKIIKLPDRLFFLYFLLRPFLWLYRHYSREPS